ncbi:TIGR03118 family protein [Aquincola tertiaricarbonis]|uniref:TIGR03118 family protein n=1 Tax=Aquincola tertiaricarbonis TaxID=391953 RepID=UPI0009FA08C0|nr:TIGR03118 family protein [Aquincola tertiaricarbonis]
MNAIPRSPHALAAVSLAVAFLAACGGRDDPARALPTAAQSDASDQPDAALDEQARLAFEATDHEVRARQLPTLYSEGSGAAALTADGDAPAAANFPGVKQSNLVASKPGYGAPIIEPEMKNAWGIAIRPAGLGGHFWIGAAGTGTSIQYVGDVGDTALFQDELAIVTTGGPATGVGFNHGAGFTITQAHANGPITAPTKFFFANASGTLSAWTERARTGGGFDHPLDSTIVVDRSALGSNFLGVTVTPDADRVLVADFGAGAQLRSYDHSFAEQTPWPNPFRPAGVVQPGGFEAFNVQALGRSVFAMYGRHVPPNPTQAPPAEGRLVEFDASGKQVARWYGRGFLNYPWGVAKAPASYGLYADCLLVGNFGDGTVVAFHPTLRVALDYVRDTSGKKVVIDGLWGLQFGNGASLGEADHMYFAAGPERETEGLFGKLQANPTTRPALGGVSMCR